jgi:polyisoprenoid-binding protein YceI
VTGRFSTGSIAVEAVMRNGTPAPGALGPKDLDKIATTARDDVLRVRAWPEATFSAPLPTAAREALSGGAASGPIRLDGALTLCGSTRPLAVEVTQADGALWQARARIHQPEFGIKPYTAMLGALKIRPEVDVIITVPAGHGA